MPSEPSAVLGFRPHTYWTAVVALAGPPTSPRVIERRRMVFAIGTERFVYHQAAEADPGKAEPLIAATRAATVANAAGDIATLVADLQRDGVRVRRAVVPAGAARGGPGKPGGNPAGALAHPCGRGELLSRRHRRGLRGRRA